MRTIVVLAVVAALTGVCDCAAETSSTGNRSLCLAERGSAAAYCIELSADAGPTERHAADELSEYVFRQTGVRLPILEARKCPGGDARRAVRIMRDDSRGADAFRLRSAGEDVIVSGGERGVLYGVYELLETYGGVGWFSPDRTVIPKRDAFVVPGGLDVSQSPAFEMREALWFPAFRDADFCARLRLNGNNYTPFLPKHGGKPYRFGGGLPIAHTLAKLVPAAKYAKEHPEYFALVGGIRDTKESAQLCLTNPDVLRIATEGVLAAIKRDPAARYFGVSQNDNQRYCTCEKCAAVDAEEESHAGTMIRFVNAVAAAVEREYPDKVIETLAYQYTRKPPKLTRPRKNVMICLCTIECDYAHPIATGADKQNASFRSDVDGWKKCANYIYIWDYTTNFSHYPGVFPNFDVLQPNIRFFREIGTKFLFEQGANMGAGAEFAALKTWMLAKWMWNPDLPEGELLDRFFKGYYGKAAPRVREYFDALRALPRPDGKFRLGCFHDISSQKLVSDEFLVWADGVWQQAEDAVRGEDPVVVTNVRLGRFSVDYMRFMRLKDRVLVPPELSVRLEPPSADMATLQTLARRIDALRKDVPKLRLAESGVPSDSRFAAVSAALKDPLSKFRPSSRIELEEDRFSIFGRNRWCRLEKDPSASGGQALDIFPSDNASWCMQLEMPGGAFDPKGKYRLGVRAKIVPAKNAAANGRMLEAGVWDRSNERAIGAWTVRACDVRPGEWMQFDLGEFSVDTPQLTVWLSGGKFDGKRHKTNPDLSSLLVDRVDIGIADAENGQHLRITERMSKAEVGRVIDELMLRKPVGH